MSLQISIEDPLTEDVRALLQTHLDFCHSVTPPENSYAMDVEKLRTPGITVFGARENGILLGVGALRELDTTHAEIKSMHTTKESRGKGVGKAMVEHILIFAQAKGIQRVSLETGRHEPYEPARKLYEGFGFKVCPPFGEYKASEFNMCMTLLI
ncbi:MAG: GNAT family N-acetyltransferase [Actinomycetota bacterium]